MSLLIRNVELRRRLISTIRVVCCVKLRDKRLFRLYAISTYTFITESLKGLLLVQTTSICCKSEVGWIKHIPFFFLYRGVKIKLEPGKWWLMIYFSAFFLLVTLGYWQGLIFLEKYKCSCNNWNLGKFSR